MKEHLLKRLLDMKHKLLAEVCYQALLEIAKHKPNYDYHGLITELRDSIPEEDYRRAMRSE